MPSEIAVSEFAVSEIAATPSTQIEYAFTIFAFSAIFLQKFGLPLPGVGLFFLDVLILWAVAAWLVVRGLAVVDPVRMVLFFALVCTVILSLVLEQGIFSLPGLLLFLSIYGMLLFRVDVDRATYLLCLRKFQAMMVWVACIVIGQQIVQFTVGNQWWPNLNKLFPASLLIPGFMYLRTYEWGSSLYMPNGIVFLEPSFMSQCLAVALAIEIIWFQRIKYAALYGMAMMIAMTGTGITITVLLAPFLFMHMGQEMRQRIMKVALPLALFAGLTGGLSFLLSRSGELSSSNSSGYARIVRPFNLTIDLLSDPKYLFSGNGPGSIPKTTLQVQWPSSKISYEYGNLACIMFLAFYTVAMLRTAASRTLACVTLIPQLFFGGAFALPPAVMVVMISGSLLQIVKTVSPSVHKTSVETVSIAN